MTLPTVIGIGFPKAATTFLAAALNEHPEVCMSSRKETHFFERYETRGAEKSSWRGEYAAYFDAFSEGDQRFSMEWTTSYITNRDALERMKCALGERLDFLIATRDPVASFLSTYFYYRTISNDSLAARLSQMECAKRYPEIFLDPFRYGSHYRSFREVFPDARAIIIPHESMKRSSDDVLKHLFQALGISQKLNAEIELERNASYPYRYWWADKLIRWVLVKMYGDYETRRLYGRLPKEKPPFVRLIHALNSADYTLESEVNRYISRVLLPEYSDFCEQVRSDGRAVIIGSRDDLLIREKGNVST